MVKLIQSDTELLATLQKEFGSADFAKWQFIRQPFYSLVTYPVAGSSSITLFADAIGVNGTTREMTNLPKPGSFGQQHFLLKSIETIFWIEDPEIASATWAGTNATALYSDLCHGFTQGGYLELSIGSRLFAQIPRPFEYAASGRGQARYIAEGWEAFTLAEAAPNTLASYISPQPFADLANRNKTAYFMDPNLLIEADQNFSVQINYPTGLIPALATSIIDTNNPLKVGVILDGIVIRPMQ